MILGTNTETGQDFESTPVERNLRMACHEHHRPEVSASLYQLCHREAERKHV